MSKHIFKCIDGHTCGNPVRIVTEGKPNLIGATMAEKRLHFIREFDWIRKGLMFEPRGHDLMSGSFFYPPTNPKNDAGIIFIETSGSLPMCGHGTIGAITIGIENELIQPKKDGTVRLETPAGLVIAAYDMEKGKVRSVKIRNVPAYLHAEGLEVVVNGLGAIKVDVAYGGNFYAIIDAQEHYSGIQDYGADQLIGWSRAIRAQLNEQYEFIHPLDSSINGLSHVLWTGNVLDEGSTARNAVFYGDKALDRSPCGTGTSARMAQWAAQNKLKKGEEFIHESIIGSTFTGKIEALTTCGPYQAIIPSIEGWAKITGYNTLVIDTDDDPYALGFQVL